MKKKTIKELKEKQAQVKNLKEMRFLLKGINIDANHIRLGESHPDWPITAPAKEGGILHIGNYNIGHVSNNGFYYCEFQDFVEDKKGIVYLSYYNPEAVELLMELDEDADINPHDFYSYDIKPNFERLYKKESLEKEEKNFIDIINKDMKKRNKKSKKIEKKRTNK